VLTMSTPETPSHPINPYLAGVLLGLVLLASFVLLGAGLGASGGLARLAAFGELCVAPAHTLNTAYFGAWGGEPLRYYLVFMLLGTVCGGLITAFLGGRLLVRLERGAACASGKRALFAVVGGILAGYASRLASGCTSGQAMTGSALLMTGSLVFLVCVFAAGYAAAWFFRSQWHD